MKKRFVMLLAAIWISVFSFPVSASTVSMQAVRINVNNLLAALFIGFLLSLGIAFLFKARLKTARLQSYARNYIRSGSFHLRRSRDQYLYSNTTRVRVRDSKR